MKKIVAGEIAIRIPDEKKSFTTQKIFATCNKLNIRCIKQKNITSSKQLLLKKIKPELIIVTGSLYLVGKIRKLFI